MGIILWIIFGAVAGWIASMLMKTNSSHGTIMDVVLGVVGAVVGGFLMGLVGQPGVTGFNLYSLIVAVIGASGAGKSTIIKLITRHYDPTAGNIYLDGVDIKKMSLKELNLQKS